MADEALPAPEPTLPRGRKLVGRALMLVVTGVALYIVAPSLIATFGSLPQLETVFPAWFVPIFVLEAAAFVCIWQLIRVALNTDAWFDVGTSQLAGNALSRALPGGAATGGALQIRMLSRAGYPVATTTTALTAVGLLSTAVLFVLPVLALPAVLFGLAVNSELVRGAIFAVVVAVFLLGGGSVLLMSDGVVRRLGHVFDWVLHRVRPHRVAPTSMADRLLESRNVVRGSLSASWKVAVPAAFGNQFFDYLALETSLLAVGARREPLPRAARLRGGGGARDDPDHAGGTGVRGGRPHRCARAGGRVPRARGPGDPALPALLLLAPAPGRLRRVDPVQPAPRRLTRSAEFGQIGRT